MDPQNSGLDCILCRDLEVLLRQSFQSSSQVSVAACSRLSRPIPYAPSWIPSRQSFLGRDSILFFSIFILLRHIFLWLLNNMSCKVCCFNHSMSRQSYVWFFEELCCDIDNFVVTEFLCSFFKLVSLQLFCFGSYCNNVSCIVIIFVAT